jgi:hypothetical protein
VTVQGASTIAGVSGYTFKVDWDTKKLELRLSVYSSSGSLLYDSTPKTLTAGSVTFTSSKLVAEGDDDAPYAGTLIDSSGVVLTGTQHVALIDDIGNGIDAAMIDRLTEAMAYLDVVFTDYGFALTWAGPDDEADIFLHYATTTPMGGKADGVLGFTQNDSVWFVSGWNFYSGSETAGIAANQFDFQTVATHELGHVLGLGHSADASSVMYGGLSAGNARREFSEGDLGLINGGGSGGAMTAEGGFLHAGADGGHQPGCDCPLCHGVFRAGPAPEGHGVSIAAPAAPPEFGRLLAGAGTRLPGALELTAWDMPVAAAPPKPAGAVRLSLAAAPPIAWDLRDELLAERDAAHGDDTVLLGGDGEDLLLGDAGGDVLVGGIPSARLGGRTAG